MTVFDRLQPLIDTVQDKIRHNIKDEFPQTLKEPIRYFLETPGKRVRPLLTLLSCQAVGGRIEDAVPAAVGIELFHDFTLIHDDIMDQDELRRGRPTIHRHWDEGTAILVGDALIGMAYANMLECDRRHLPAVMEHFSEGLIKVCEGQALDKEFENRKQTTVNDYMDMIAKKTAWLFKLSAHIGAILGNGSAEQVQSMLQFGHNLGIGFQIQDDLLDLVADERVLGKKVGSDLKLGKKTYVSLKYSDLIRRETDLASRYPESLEQFDDLESLQQALHDLKILEETEQVVKKTFQQALDELQTVQALDSQNDMYQIVRFLQSRQY